MEESLPAETKQAREAQVRPTPAKERSLVSFDSEEDVSHETTPTPKKTTKPTTAKKPIEQPQPQQAKKETPEEAAPQESGKKPSATSQEPRYPQKAEGVKPYFEEDDHVVIKSIKERIADEVPLSSVKPNPDQPRTSFKKEEMEELAASIEKEGLLQPILVRSIGKEYQIIAGERRWQACQMLGKATIPIRVHEADEDKALELALVENIHREDLNPIEEAYGFRRLMERRGLTQSEVAETVSKGRSTVANALRLLELPEDAQQLLFEEKISAGHARAILSVPSKEGRQKLTERMVKEKMSVREAESLARLFAGAQNKAGTPVRKPVPKSFKAVARALRETLKANVRVKTVQGKNKIEIEFKDEEELERLFGIITASEQKLG